MISRNKSTAAWHSEGVSTHGGGNFIFRYNMWQDISGTAVIVNLNQSTSNWEIYGNVFYETGTDPYVGVGHGVIASNTGGISPMSNVKVYNNTVAFISGANASLGRFFDGGSGNEVYNNLYYHCAQVNYSSCTHDYDLIYNTHFATTPGQNSVTGSGNPFVDSSGLDFRLAGPTANGLHLGSPYNLDLLGLTRGLDSVWDRGAYEYDPTQEPGEPPAPTPYPVMRQGVRLSFG